jgi:hypothetical protein
MILPAKHLINIRLLKTVKNFTLKVELGVVSLEATLYTETSFTVRTPKYCLPPRLVYSTPHTSLLVWPSFQ